MHRFFPESITSGQVRAPALLLVLLVSAALVFVMPATAHAPTDMDIFYDPVTSKLSVTITHPVDDPATHYISKVQVKHNNHVISDPDYKSQPTKDTFTYTYDRQASPPDVFWVLATCSRGGSLEKKYEIPVPTARITAAPTPAAAQETPAALPATTQKSPAGLLPALGAAAFLLMLRRG
jgi:hypothetical protein